MNDCHRDTDKVGIVIIFVLHNRKILKEIQH